MKQVLQYNREQLPRVKNVPEPQIKGPGLIVNNRVSLVSSGTERQIIDMFRMTLAGKAKERPDLVKQVISKMKTEGLTSTYKKVMNRLNQPFPLGYSSSGTVESIHNAVSCWTVGDRVACAGLGYAAHAETIFVPANLAVKIPENVSYEEASFVTLGAIALQGVRVADIRLGETVAVVGLGLLGQLTCMLLQASGCRIIGLDIDSSRFELAKQSGADRTTLADSSAVEAVMDASAGRGVDAVIITTATDSAAPIELAGEICREKGTVIVVGTAKMDVPRKPYYNKELSLRLSRSYGPGRNDYAYEEVGHDYPYGYVRWTENRNMQAFLQLIEKKRIDVSPLITHRFTIDEAEKAYALVTGQVKEPYLAVVLNYPEKEQIPLKVLDTNSSNGNRETAPRLNIGFIGAGNFAGGVLLPHLAAQESIKLKAIASGSGITAHTAAERFKFERTASSNEEIINDPAIGSVFIATRHNQHADLVIRALKNNKAVFVEKPLCLTETELDKIVQTHSVCPQPLMVGFNRRFAPLIDSIKSVLRTVDYPLSMHYRINAGFIPEGTWIQDMEVGGGRIIGEVCHFIDLLAYLTDSLIVKVTAESLSMPDERYRSDDNLQIMLRFANGSVGTINYVASGSSHVSKEYLEIFGGGLSVRMDDFKSVVIANERGVKLNKKRSQDKGHARMLHQWCHYLKNTSEPPISMEQIINSTTATLAVINSLATGEGQWIGR